MYNRFRSQIRGLLLSATLSLGPGCDSDSAEQLQGYAEGEFVYVASQRTGLLQTLSVERGAEVKAGDALFELQAAPERAVRDQAKRELEQAQATLADLTKGQRPSEVAEIEALLSQARAAVVYSEGEYDRLKGLEPSGGASVQELRKAFSDRDQDRQRVAQYEAQLETARLGSRTDQVKAAEAQVQARAAALAKAEWDLSQMRQAAPQGGVVFDTLFRPGEQVPANRPVVALLPPENIKVRTFVPQAIIGTFKQGDPVTVTADGIAGAVPGRVSFISPQVEYTPPVIYSKESREKLVMMIEIRFAPEEAVKLHPGQPVDVVLRR